MKESDTFFSLLRVEEDDINWRGKSQVENSSQPWKNPSHVASN